MQTYAFHNGARFRAETTHSRGAIFVVDKRTNQSVYVKGDDAVKLHNALYDGWKKFGSAADGDDVWQWIWTNCGFYRMAGASA